MKILSFLLLAASVTSTAVDSVKAVDISLELSLWMAGNTRVKASLTNVGENPLKLLKTGTLLDSKPTEKVQIYSTGARVPFKGVRINILRTGLVEDHFTTIQPKESIELQFDMAELHDLSIGGTFFVFSQGTIPLAAQNSTMLSGQVASYTSNMLRVSVNGAQASRVKLTIDRREGRTRINTDCNGERRAAVLNALNNCGRLAKTAADAAINGSASKFEEYFKTTSDGTRQTVNARLLAVSRECNSTSVGATQFHCADSQNLCRQNVLSYTLPSRNMVVSCPLYFSDQLPDLSTRCHGQDRATTTLHEFTHAPGVYRPGTEDNGYGYAAASRLNAREAILNADTYALYANAISVGC